MTDSQLKTFIDTKFNDWYAVVFIVFVVYAAVLYVFDLLPAWDPSVIALPIIVSKAIYAAGAISGLTVLGGMGIGAFDFYRDHKREKRLAKLSLWMQEVGLSIHILSLISLAISTALVAYVDGHFADIAWIAPTTLMIAGPHMVRALRIVREIGYVDYKYQLQMTVKQQYQAGVGATS